MARKKAQDELTRDMIVEVADAKFLQEPFSNVSMRAIAKQLGCSHSAIYYHFKNKTELFNAVVEKYFAILHKGLDEASALDTTSGTERVLLHYLMFGLTYPSQYEFMFVKREDALDPLLLKISNDSYEAFSEALQLLHNHQLQPAAIHSTFMALHGFVLCYKGRVSDADGMAAAKRHCAFIMKALVD